MTNKQNLENFIQTLNEVEAKRLMQLLDFEIADRLYEVLEDTFEQEGEVEKEGKKRLIKKFSALQTESLIVNSDILNEVWKIYMTWNRPDIGTDIDAFFEWLEYNTEEFVDSLKARMSELTQEEIDIICSAEGIEQITAYLDSVV